MAKISINLATGTLQKAEIIAGIDLGTSNSLVAFIDPDNKPMVINDTGKGRLVPSIVHFDAAGQVRVGHEAKDLLLTAPAENQPHSPIEVSAEILKELRKRAEHALKTPVNKVVITVPAYFKDSQRQAVRDAGRLAGLEVLKIINESTAAALAYGTGLDPAQQKTIAVYDLGGGSFSISIYKIQNGKYEVRSAIGNSFPAGNDFDQAIINYWIESNRLDAAATTADHGLMQQLRLKAETAKIALGSQNLFNEKLGDIWCTLDKQTFEKLISAMVAETINSCTQALANANITLAGIDDLLLAGGSTRTPYVKEQVAAYFGKQPNDQINPDEIVALGAAIQADIMAGNRSYISLPDEDVHIDEALTPAAAQRMLDEARAEGEQLAYLAGQFIERHRFVLTSMDISGTREILDKLRAALKQDDPAIIRQFTNELNEFTRPFAARLMKN
ncbi:Hsp70 protein [Pedobacter westerhofensis]|uniref:Hsp70 protein n=1 Tax=Pedobacter westerhofensis TaxID=425512 RepID=A0A521FP41_9SPHI|nr:Hsp70 family protein [Pedobacter westerhofensis]SMO97932.1 Hsp70 protein [Pedobacter westerhofensis]